MARVLKVHAATTLTRSLPVNLTDGDVSVFSRVGTSHVNEIVVANLRNASVIFNGTIFRWFGVEKNMLLANDEGHVVKYSFFSDREMEEFRFE